ncbi:hypothetical protein PPROV_000941300 [Pycnococcus provasolii]|uniref:Uncharacterized protein n=1 Tax=Pycnococcus provasolii TaxID=41880 RepID=A0A830HU93_9CHLO|nr:hypothetical protein PPROV_000941300 [Pycnococcus provasolii]|mmetsp:Transcript_6893/g.15733  ORF Transcript_6893/g.15733 Transcript_6893/m.15733 type:complete len:107 (-) Transcript_6893:630-950(-)
MILCIGPCCFPLWQLLPVFLAFMHQRGYLRFIKREWVTLRFYLELVGLQKPREKVIGIPKKHDENTESEGMCCANGVCTLPTSTKSAASAPPPAPAASSAEAKKET